MKKFHEIDMSDYDIGKYEALELKYFCLTYPDKEKRLNTLKAYGELNDALQEEYERLDKDIKAVRTAVTVATSAQSGLYEPLLRNLTRNESINKMPCGKNQAYTLRKRAFYILKKIKSGKKGHHISDKMKSEGK